MVFLNNKKLMVFCLLIITSVSIFADSAADLSWLEMTAGNEKLWEFSDQLQEIDGRYYTRKDSAAADYTVVILIAKKSSSYITAFNTFLEVMEKDIPNIDIYAFNCSKSEELALPVFAFAKEIDADIFIAMGSEATAFANKHLKGKDIPVVTCINKDPVLSNQIDDYKSGSSSNIAFTSVNVPVNVNTEWLLKAKPGLKCLAILYDPDHSKVVGAEVEPFVAYLETIGIKIYKCAIPSEEGVDIKQTIQKEVAGAFSFFESEDPGVDNSVFWLTSSTNIFSELETVAKSARQIPVISSVPDNVNSNEESPVMAIGINRASAAELATQYVIEILKGNIHPGDLPVGIVTPPDIAINFRTAKRIGYSIPFEIFENAGFIYGYNGEVLKKFGEYVEEQQ